jgi:hypothetical protein
LAELTLPASITSVGRQAFDGVKNLSRLTWTGEALSPSVVNQVERLLARPSPTGASASPPAPQPKAAGACLLA